MQYVQLGRTQLRASRLGFGCSQSASLSTAHTPSEVRATLLEAFEKGINFFDTADVYGQGDSERLLGKLFKGRRDQVILCSKAGLTVGVIQNLMRWSKPIINPLVRRWPGSRHKIKAIRREMERKCFEPDYIRCQIEGSLRRLNTDHLDLFLLHSPPVEILLRGTVFTTLQALKNTGTIRYYGVSCDSTQQALTAMEHAGVSCLQIPINILQRQMIKSVLPLALAKGIGILAREPLAGGAVFGHPGILAICHADPTCSPARLAFRYVLQKNDTSVILAGMGCRRHLQDNLKNIASPPLSAQEMVRLEAAAGHQQE